MFYVIFHHNFTAVLEPEQLDAFRDEKNGRNEEKMP